jgi:prepilin-type N-terminal cleavage/methylation domain-containing protein
MGTIAQKWKNPKATAPRYRIHPRHLGSSKFGFTLPEILVVMALLAIFSLSLYSIYIGGIRNFKSGSDRSEALQAASLVYQKLVYDFKRAIFDPSHSIKVLGTPPSRLEFHVLSQAGFS